MNFLFAGVGGALGSMARYWVSATFNTAGFPWGTLAVNILGSAVIGLLAGLGVSGGWRLFLITGVLGGFTTFSAFSLETGLLWQRSPVLAAVYVVGSVGLGLAAFFVAWGVTKT